MALNHPSRSTRIWTSRSSRIVCFASLLLISVLASRSSISALLRQAWYDQRHSYILLIVPVSLFLLLLEQKKCFVTRWNWRAGGMPMLVGFAITPWGLLGASLWWADNRLSFAIAALVAFSIAAFILCFGPGAFHAFRFSLLFLFLLAPLPDLVLHTITYVLQWGSTEVADILFAMCGVPVGRNGFVLSLPGLDIEVTSQCSGIRSSMILLVTSIVLSHLYLKSGWKQMLVGALVLPIAIFKNGLRVFVLCMLALYVDPEWLEGWLHRSGGFVFFSLGLAIITLLIAALRRSECKGKNQIYSCEPDLSLS